jgi:ABC-2 type transport system permease protein
MSSAPATRSREPGAIAEQAIHGALASGERPPRPSTLSAAITFGWRGMLKIKHVPEQLIDATITPVLFLVMFTYLFGGAVAGSTGETISTTSCPASSSSPCCSRACIRASRSTRT